MEVVKFFQTGGPFMYPILIVLALGVAIAIERFLYITRTHSRTNKVWGQLVPMLKANDYERAMKMTEQQRTPLALMLNYGFARLGSTRRRDDIEAAMEEGMMEVMPELEQRTHYLATFANIATLLGLADPAEKADLLSASISVAMNTTAFGLVAAIPMILLHSYLQTKTARLIDNLEMAAVKCLNLMTKEG